MNNVLNYKGKPVMNEEQMQKFAEEQAFARYYVQNVNAIANELRALNESVKQDIERNRRNGNG